MKTGIGPVVDREQAIYQGLTASAIHEILNQAVIDTSILYFHQLNAIVCYLEDQGKDVHLDSDGKWQVYSPEEEKAIRKDLIEVVWKYHVLHDKGLFGKLTPLIESLQTGQPVNPHIVQQESILQSILAGSNQHIQVASTGNMQAMVAQIMDQSAVTKLTDAQFEELVMPTFPKETNIVIYEDDHVQCTCDFCEHFFEINELANDVFPEDLNYLQLLMAEQFGYFTAGGTTQQVQAFSGPTF